MRVRPRARVASDAEDAAAISTFLANGSTQVAAAVATCSAKLDDATKAEWTVLASDIRRYVSVGTFARSVVPDVAQARVLRTRLNAFAAKLKTLGCGDVPSLMASAPPPVEAPPPTGKPNPVLSVFEGPQAWVALALLLYFLHEKVG